MNGNTDSPIIANLGFAIKPALGDYSARVRFGRRARGGGAKTDPKLPLDSYIRSGYNISVVRGRRELTPTGPVTPMLGASEP